MKSCNHTYFILKSSSPFSFALTKKINIKETVIIYSKENGKIMIKCSTEDSRRP